MAGVSLLVILIPLVGFGWLGASTLIGFLRGDLVVIDLTEERQPRS